MRIALSCVLLALSACGPDEIVPDVPVDASPDSEPPTSDGEYVIKMTPTHFVCVSSGPLPLEPAYSVANLVDQDAWTSDLSSELQGTFLEYDQVDLERGVDGGFYDESEDEIPFPGGPLTRRRRLEGSTDGRTLAFSHHYDIGWKDAQGLYHSECVYEADVKGTALYERWDGVPASGISGQWRVTRTVEESTDGIERDLPDARADIITIVSQAPDDSSIQLIGLFRIPSRWLTREPLTGRIEDTETHDLMYTAQDGGLRTWRLDTATIGTVRPGRIDIEQSLRSWTLPTGALPAEEHSYRRESYRGVPRYRTHDGSAEEGPHGTYLASYEMIWNDCGYAPYRFNKLLHVLPIGESGIWPRITGSDREPILMPDADGIFSAPFTRSTSFWRYDYFIDGRLDGHYAEIAVTSTRRDPQTGAYDCSATYSIAGPKLYMTARP